MLTLEHVNKKIGSFELKDISMELPKGYIMGLIGQNGAGKTSLLYLILGLYKQNTGEISVLGMNYEMNEREIRDGLGFTLVDELFYGDLSLKQNADMFGKYYKNYDARQFAEYCKEFELDELKKLKKLSKGEKLKFQFAFALSHAPKLLILDEPTANFDPQFRKKFMQVITKFVSDGEHSVILATHLTTDLDQIADYIMFLHKGEMLFYMDKESLNDAYRMVGGEEYKINLLKKEKIIYKEKGQYGSKALVRHSRLNRYDGSLQVSTPTLEEIMYFIVKGGYHV